METSLISTNTTAVILVHYGDPQTTCRCLRALHEMQHAPFIIVSNNGTLQQAQNIFAFTQALSPNTTLIRPSQSELTAQAPPSDIIIIHNNANKGFAAGCNIGIQLALTHTSAQYIWLLNNDTRPADTALRELLKCISKDPKQILGASIVKEGTNALQLAGGVQYSPSTSRITIPHAGSSINTLANLTTPAIDYVYGASLFTTASFYQKAGLLDERFFLFYEELDICLRARKLGYTLTWCRNCIVEHEISAAIGTPTASSQAQSQTAAYHEARSTILFTCKHYLSMLPAVLCARLMAKPFFLIKNKQVSNIPSALKGLLDGLAYHLSKCFR